MGSGRLRILHVITGLACGGAERALGNVLCAGLADRFECRVVSLRDRGVMAGAIEGCGVPVAVMGLGAIGASATAVRKLVKATRTSEPDIVQGWMYHGNLAASLAALLAPGRPAVAWNVRQSLYELKNEKRLTRQVIRVNRSLAGKAQAIVYNSWLSRRQHEAFGFEASRGRVIPNGFDLERLRPEPETGKAVRQELGLPDGAHVVGHVARFHPMKDHTSFLRAAVKVAREIPSARFVLAGREVSPDNPALAGIVPPELLERFVFTGERGDVQRLMQAMDVLATSSAWGEAFPNVVGEAMACGVPCVVTDVGDSTDIVGESGIVVPPSDHDALARALLEMLRKRPEERQALGQAARQRIEAHYGLESVVDQYADLYTELAARVSDE